jgi:thioester reductase-like protein
MTNYFVTGGTGFIGKRFLLNFGENERIFLLVRPESLRKAEKIIKKANLKRVEIVKGDLEQKRLGLSQERIKEIFQDIDYIYHMGASYDPSLPKEKIFRIILKGTEELSFLAKRARNLKAFIYISTAYVAGERVGKILENLPDIPPKFHNSYEEAKFKTEIFLREVRLPVVVIRPALVVGDSQTGEFDKEVKSGIYMLIKLIDKGLFFFYPGECRGFLSAVPVNWVGKAIFKIGQNKKSIGKIFHLADEKPMTAREFIDRVCVLLGKRKPLFEMPKEIISILPIGRFRSQIMILNQKQIFDMTNTKRLLGEKNLASPLVSYLPILINYYKKFLK